MSYADASGPEWLRGLGYFLVLVVLALLLSSCNSPVPRNTPLSLSEQRDSIVTAEARRAGVPVGLSIAVSHVENWTGDSMAVSPRGAVGIMQVLPKFWQHSFEEECGCGSLFPRKRNACVGVRVLGSYLKQYKTTAQALRAYHGSLNYHKAGDAYLAALLDQLIAD